jgi:SAM-dependent methyltransferase
MTLKLDLGCGRTKRDGFTGVDSIAFPGVDIVTNLADLLHTKACDERREKEQGCTCPRDRHVFKPWPWENDSVDEAVSSHFVEHLDAHQRRHFVEELWRVLKPEATAQIIVPYAFSERAYGDLTHQWPPLVGFWFFYLDASWCAQNSAHHTYKANFSVGWGHNPREDMKARNPEYIQEALAKELNASMDMIANFTKKPMPVTP